MNPQKTIAVIGLGYVGLPLALEFAKQYPTIGFDINLKRIKELKKVKDITLEVDAENLSTVLVPCLGAFEQQSYGFLPTIDRMDISEANVFIITVPTPTDKNNRPVLTPLIEASKTVANALKKGDIVIYESTVYPGVTEDECVPVLEAISGLQFNTDFFVGYSPERINPGDKERTITKILKVTSGSTPESAKDIDDLYQSIISAGTHRAPSIKVAEAAKVIENAQRDINIAFVNELAKIFNLLEIDTAAVLKAASTKWNFLPFKPGLVGGLCIGVDPYYLAQKAQEIGYHPEIILAGRRLNDSMGEHVATEVLKLVVKNDIKVKAAKVLILGITFKENCPDIRNTKVVDVITHLQGYGMDITIYDPWADPDEVQDVFQLCSTQNLPEETFDVMVLTVAQKAFKVLDFNPLLNTTSVVYDVKGVLGTIADAKL
ncbi:MAG: nucleotide sugar dehydrogenase [Flavobacteriaceae bacterium]|jgi:UDP-N-acetyl-D-glucosamine/UDP-N-acetyl-D-galactosamine dehydrogenase|nr:nucleotide sugar dehydrogenase [Flavobacteriaceae bacterium]